MSIGTKISEASNLLGTVKNLQISRKYPLSLVHFVTKRCNARCSFCFIDFDDPKTFRNELSLVEIEKITKSCGPYLQNVNITGGEPFARKDIAEICRLWLKNSGIRSMYITTNGSLPERIIKTVQELNKEFPSKKIFVSISIDELETRHDEIRKIKGLFSNCIKSYEGLKKVSKNVQPNIGITVSPENYTTVESLYDHLVYQNKITALTVTIVRDEGVFKIPPHLKNEILGSYKRIVEKINRDRKANILTGFDNNSLQGKLMNSKNSISNRIVSDTYLDPTFVSPCRAASLFGVIEANGDVYPCEILENKKLGTLKDYDYNFTDLWHDDETARVKNWILETKCNCTYECALSFNILSSLKHQPKLIKGAIFGEN